MRLVWERESFRPDRLISGLFWQLARRTFEALRASRCAMLSTGKLPDLGGWKATGIPLKGTGDYQLGIFAEGSLFIIEVIEWATAPAFWLTSLVRHRAEQTPNRGTDQLEARISNFLKPVPAEILTFDPARVNLHPHRHSFAVISEPEVSTLQCLFKCTAVTGVLTPHKLGIIWSIKHLHAK